MNHRFYVYSAKKDYGIVTAKSAIDAIIAVRVKGRIDDKLFAVAVPEPDSGSASRASG